MKSYLISCPASRNGGRDYFSGINYYPIKLIWTWIFAKIGFVFEEKGYVPLPEANTERLRTTLELPFGVGERIGLNVKRIHLLCQLGGFRFLRLSGNWESEVSAVEPQIVGFNSEGGAYAGGAAVRKVPTYDYDCNQQRRSIYHQANWSDLRLELNLKEIQQRILEKSGNLRKAESWSGQINEVLKRGLTKAGFRNLVIDLTIYDKFFVTFGYGNDFWSTLRKAMRSSQAFDLRYLLIQGLGTGLLWCFFSSLVCGPEKPGEGRRFSLFFGPELDRAAILAVLARTRPLAVPLPDNNR